MSKKDNGQPSWWDEAERVYQKYCQELGGTPATLEEWIISSTIRGNNKMEDKKDLSVTNIDDAKKKVSDIEVFGNGDLFQLISKASSKSQGWMKSTKAMDTGNGCVVQVTTQQDDNVAEALVFVPGVHITIGPDGNKMLVPTNENQSMSVHDWGYHESGGEEYGTCTTDFATSVTCCNKQVLQDIKAKV